MSSFCTRILTIASLTLSLTTLAQKHNAYVNMEKIFQGYYKTARSDGAFKKQRELYDEHAKSLATEIDAIKKQRDENQDSALNIALSDSVRREHRKVAEDKNNLYQEKKNELKSFVRKVDQELQKRYLELRGEIVKEISDFLRTYGEKKEYDLIMDTSGLSRNFIPVVIYYPKSQDITETILTQLNRGHEDELKKSSDTAADTPTPKADTKTETTDK